MGYYTTDIRFRFFMKQIKVILCLIVVTWFSGCHDKNSSSFLEDMKNDLRNKKKVVLTEDMKKDFQGFLARKYVGEREDGSKVYLMEKTESGSKYLIIKKDGSSKQAIVFAGVPEAKVLQSSQPKCIEIYKDPNSTIKNQAILDMLEKIDNGSDCSFTAF
jgi:hypothetical protein